MQHIEYHKGTNTWVPCGRVIRGEIWWDTETDPASQVPLIVVDGKPLTWQEFGRTLLTHEGFQFELKFIEPTVETD